jgi:CP family cyanate transporter-like MFS transporter
MSIACTVMTNKVARLSAGRSYGLVALLLLAANLRPALTSVGPLLAAIQANLGLSGAAVGLLPTMPLLIFAGFSPFARLGDVFGIERTLAGCLALVVAGILLRSAGSVAALFIGTAIFAIGIAIANILVPSLIKRDYPRQVENMTTAYVMVMTLAGALATGFAVPLSARLAGGWRSSLAVWAVSAGVALLCWMHKTRKTKATIALPRPDNGATGKPIWHSALAWQVTVFMGLQFLIYYVTISWMPVFLAGHGFSAAEAGWLLTLYQVTSFAVGIVAPTLMRRGSDQRALAVVASLVTAGCILALLLAPRLAGLWLVACGASFGITFILAFALISMRASDHRRAAALSIMSQAAAYLIAAAGPVAFGWLHDISANWTVPMLSLLAVAICQAVAGLGAGRQRQV